MVANAEGIDAAAQLVGQRRGRTLSPVSADALLSDPGAALAPLATGDLWDAMLDVAPRHAAVAEDELDVALAGIGDFVDLKALCLVGHSRGVAELAANAAAELGAAEHDIRTVRRAGWVHDVGRVAVSSAIWDKPAPLNADQREKVRLHSYYTGRVLDRVPGLADVAAVAVCHHERLDGSGYHAGTKSAGLTELARILAAADAFHAMTEARPYRPAREVADAAKELDLEVGAGRIDRRAADAVKAVAGIRVPRRARATDAGLTPREVEVLRLVARGLSIKQMAQALTVSAKTVDGHLQRIYPKIGVSTRTGATLYALQHGLLNGENSP